MGTPVPTEWPDYIDDKWYCCYVIGYMGDEGKTGCDQQYWDWGACCTTGLAIKNWLAAGFECQSPYELCYIIGTTAQALVAVHGPYDTENECTPDCWVPY